MTDDWKLDEHWKVVNGGGQVISTTPQQLWDKACEYFKWNDTNPLKSKRILTSGKEAGKKIEYEYNRPYSVKAFCLHAGISERYIKDITDSHAKDSEWYVVIENIMMIIYTQNLEGGIVDLYNPILISKILNLDKEQGDSTSVVKVQIVQSQNNELANSENEILQKLDFGKVEILKDKVEDSKR